jgi:hypothetical protein
MSKGRVWLYLSIHGYLLPDVLWHRIAARDVPASGSMFDADEVHCGRAVLNGMRHHSGFHPLSNAMVMKEDRSTVLGQGQLKAD